MSVVQGEGKLCTLKCVCVQGEENVVYNDVCMRYRARERLFKVMWV